MYDSKLSNAIISPVGFTYRVCYEKERGGGRMKHAERNKGRRRGMMERGKDKAGNGVTKS